MPSGVNDKLERWDTIKNKIGDKPSLLLGNGASLAIWSKFAYPSLYDMACNTNKPHSLTAYDKAVFRQLDDTRNFEQVLSSLLIAKRINQICDQPTEDITSLYENIRTCLFSAVNEIHLPYSRLTDEIKRGVQAELAQYKSIFSTNYDLTAYWCYMHNSPSVKDFFWGEGGAQVFDQGNAVLFNNTAVIYYMHGALHLYKGKDKQTTKHVAGDTGATLLEVIRHSKEVPLFISEGNSSDKKQAILDNSYLAFCYGRFKQNKSNLVVFGHSLNEVYDNHLIEGMQKMRGWSGNRSSDVAQFAIAFGIHGPTTDKTSIVLHKARMQKLFEDKKLYFFDSTTHPLGLSNLRVG